MAFNNGYIRVYSPESESADSNGLIYEHQMIAEQKIGRKLKDGEVVHHIDRNRLNNSPNNLLVFASQADHGAFHRGGDYVIDDEGVAHCTPLSSENKTCKVCGKKILWVSEYCKECYRLLETKTSNKPNKEHLKSLIRCTPFTRIATMYGVTDNAVRKWCKYYGLPYRHRDIQKIQDADWMKI